jgi:predicted ester cyclase
MGTEEHKAAIRRISDEFWNAGRADVWDEVLAPSVVDHGAGPGQGPGREGIKQFNFAFRAALPDMRMTVEDLLADEDKVVLRWSMEATHQGLLVGIPATGKRVAFSGVCIDRFAGGRIVERWFEMDWLGLLEQIGAVPATWYDDATDDRS